VIEEGAMPRSEIWAAILLGLLLAGCETTSAAQQRAADESRCRSYGFRRGTDGFSKCLLDIDLDRAADRRSRRDELMLSTGRFGPYWRY
jgi:hypothetical protein